MSVSLVASGTGNGGAALTVGTELTVYNPSPGVPGVYQLIVDLTLLADGDTLELRGKQIPLTGGSAVGVYFGAYSGAQPADEAMAVSLPISNDLTDNGAVQFSLRQPTGVGRAPAWKVLRIA